MVGFTGALWFAQPQLCLVVIENGQLAGVISMTDVVRKLILE